MRTPSNYKPHQGHKECARRRWQLKRLQSPWLPYREPERA